ncbi:MAG: hypothetical protein J6V32_04680 [Elusimicrobiaceae bacterium]|nr:hypothetical protein [Elusimicrobiaceae bacterium]
MKIGRFIILPWSKKNFIPRVIAIIIGVCWLAVIGWGVLHAQKTSRLIAEQAAQQKAQQQRRLEQERRQAAYQQRFLQQQQQRRSRNNVQNAIDGVKK